MCNSLWLVDDNPCDDYDWFNGPKSSYDSLGFHGSSPKLYCHALDDAYRKVWRKKCEADPWIDIPF